MEKKKTENQSDKDLIAKLREMGEDCPSELLDLLEATQSIWRKAVLKQFINDYIWKQKISNKLKWISRQQKAIIGLLIALFMILISLLLSNLPIIVGA